MDNKVVLHLHRLLLCLCCFVLTFQMAYAQARLRNIEIRAELNRAVRGSKTRENVPLASAQLFGFFEKKDAAAFLARYKAGDFSMFDDKDFQRYVAENHDIDGYELADNDGKAVMQLPQGGWVVCVPRSGDDPAMQPVLSDNTCHITIIAKISETTMEEVKSTAKAKKVIWKKVKTPRVGNRITQLPTPYPIAANLAKDNGRYGLAVNFLGLDGGDTLCHWRPFIKDGVDFHTTQHRRMGFEMIDSFNIVHDKLGRFVSRWPLRDHESDTVMFSWDLMLPQGKGRKR